MPITPSWGGQPQASSPPVRISRRPKKRTEPHPDAPAGSGLDGAPVQSSTPPQLPVRVQARNESFGHAYNAQIPQEFSADLPDPPVVGLNTGQARRDIKLPAPVYPQSVPVSSQIEGAPQPQFDSQYQPMPQEHAATQAQTAARASESPTDKMVREAGEQLAAANEEQPKKRHGIGGRLLSAAESFVIGAGKPFQQHMPQNSQELAYGLSQGAATGAYGAVNSDYPSRVRIEAKRKLRGEEYDTAVKRQSEETQNRLRSANADYAAGKGPREDLKIALKGQFDAWKTKNGDARLDETTNYHRFLTEERIAGRLSTEQYHDALVAESQENRKEKTREFDVTGERWQKKLDQDARFKELNLKVAQRRATAYEEAVRKSGSGGAAADTKKAQAAAEADVWDESAAEIESDIYQFDKENPEGERGSQYRVGKANLERQLRDARLKGDKARATAGVQTNATVTKDELKAIPDENAVRAWAQSHGRKPDAAVLLWKQLHGAK